MSTAAEIIEYIWKYRAEVLAEAGLLERLDDEMDHKVVELEVPRLLEAGWKRWDIIRYLCSLEHVNPTLDEDVALKRMAEITSKYREVK